MTNEEDQILASVFIFIIALPGLILLNAFAFMTLWSWFVVPMGVQNITMAHAFGLSLLVSLNINHIDSHSKEEGGPSTGRLVGIFLRPLLTIALGWIALQFMV